MKGFRRYVQHSHRGKPELISWMQMQCLKCGKFLSKGGRKYCSQCRPLIDSVQWHKSYLLHKKEKHFRNIEYGKKNRKRLSKLHREYMHRKNPEMKYRKNRWKIV